MGTNAGVSAMVNPTAPGPWQPCETGGFRGMIVGSVIDMTTNSTTE